MKKYKRGIDWKQILAGSAMDEEDELREKHYTGSN
jgi:hypothetical protein